MSEQMRKEFEDFAKSKGWDIIHNGQHYNHIYAYYAWQGWQASRQSLVVKLPEKYPLMTQDEVKKLLDAAGVKYE